MWTESCPLTGVCSECGLTLEWSQTLMPQKYEPTWCVEFTPSQWRVPRACLATLRRSTSPWRFWGRLSMTHNIRWRRLAVYVLFLLLPLLLAYVTTQTTLALTVRQIHVASLPNPTAAAAQLAKVQAYVQSPAYQSYLTSLPADMQARDQQRVQQQIQALQIVAQSKNTYSVSISPTQAVLEAILRPIGRTSSGQVNSLGRPFAYTAPRDLWSMAFRNDFRWTRLSTVARHGPRAAILLGMLLAGCLIMPLAMLLLPITLGRKRVRTVHLIRIAAYSLWIPSITVIACITLLGAAIWNGGANNLFLTLTDHAALTLPWLVFILWWWAAARRYLRLPHALAVAIILALLTFIAAALLVAQFFPDVGQWLIRSLLPGRLLYCS